jgi:hypothetical protein
MRKWLRAFTEITKPVVLRRFEGAWRAAHFPQGLKKPKPRQTKGRKK